MAPKGSVAVEINLGPTSFNRLSPLGNERASHQIPVPVDVYLRRNGI